MRKRRRFPVGAMAGLLISLAASVMASVNPPPQSQSNVLALWYPRPAQEWVEALPIGNGRLGAMVFGGVEEEHLQLNEDTVWAGQPLQRERAGALKYLDEARRLLFDGKYVEGQRIMQQRFMSERLIRSYQTLGDLRLRFNPVGEVSDYQRRLDLDTAIASVRYRTAGVEYRREIFASPVDQVLVVRLTCDRPGKISTTVSLSRPADATTACAGSDQLYMQGQVTQAGEHAGVHFAARLQAIPQGGVVIADANGLRIENADAVTLLLAAGTDYRGSNPGDQSDAVGPGGN